MEARPRPLRAMDDLDDASCNDCQSGMSESNPNTHVVQGVLQDIMHRKLVHVFRAAFQRPQRAGTCLEIWDGLGDVRVQSCLCGSQGVNKNRR